MTVTEPIVFTREDWTLFRTPATLAQKAGVPVRHIRRLVAKEVVDNALDIADATGRTLVGLDAFDDGTIRVEDNGPGIPGTPEAIAALFSIRRPLTSTKLLRLPTRGALGNGLRVVAGAVLASEGHLNVWTRNMHLRLTPKDDGTTAVTCAPVSWPHGTRIDVWLGPALPWDDSPLEWANQALMLGNVRRVYRGKTSAHWYDTGAFFELLQAAGAQSVRRVVAEFDGCSGPQAGVVARDFLNCSANDLSRDESAALLATIRSVVSPVNADRLGHVGRHAGLPPGYAKTIVTMSGGRHQSFAAHVPMVIEAWAKRLDPGDDDMVAAFVNRTPVTDPVGVDRLKGTEVVLFGCELGHPVKVGRSPMLLLFNVTTPYIPLTSDGKAPDLSGLAKVIVATIEQAARSAIRQTPVAADKKRTHKDSVRAFLADGIAFASGNGRYRYSERQLFYALRERVHRDTESELNWDNFKKIIGDIESERGDDLPGITRDNRGVLYHPHTGETIPLGTINVERYERPLWTFNKILYAEKEGLFEALIAERWPEKHDCALLTSKGFATRAARDVIDLLGETDEDLLFFCIHDADGHGTTIYQSLQEATRIRPRRVVEVVNLGIEPAEGRAMGLQVETFASKDPVRVADYVPADDVAWLQTQRIELNAMTTPDFITWLDGKMDAHGQGKLIPPISVLTDQLNDDVEERIREDITERILRENDVDGKVSEMMTVARPIIEAWGNELPSYVSSAFVLDPAQAWTAPVAEVAAKIA